MGGRERRAEETDRKIKVNFEKSDVMRKAGALAKGGKKEVSEGIAAAAGEERAEEEGGARAKEEGGARARATEDGRRASSSSERTTGFARSSTAGMKEEAKTKIACGQLFCVSAFDAHARQDNSFELK